MLIMVFKCTVLMFIVLLIVTVSELVSHAVGDFVFCLKFVFKV